MTAPQKRDAIAGYALAFAAVIIALIIVSLVGMAEAAAGGVRRAACNVVHQQAVVTAVPYPVIGYQVGQHLQQQAVDEYGFRASPSKERLTFLEGYYQAQQERLTDSGLGSAGPSRPATGHPAATERGQTNCEECRVQESGTSEPQAFSAPLAPDNFAATHPTLAAACAGCHSGEAPKGELNIAHEVTAAKASGDCPTILTLVEAIASGSMPKGKPMSDADGLKAIQELLSK